MNTKPVPMPGKLLDVILKQICARPEKDMPDKPVHSIAIGPNGIAATDSRQALVVGELDDIYVPTDRKSSLLEASRAGIYSDTCEFENIERMADPSTGEPKQYPNIAAVLENMNRMVHVADFDPELLKRAAQVAVAAGADRISLYHVPSGEDHSLLGFAFDYRIDVMQLEFDFDDKVQTHHGVLCAKIPCKAVIASLDKKHRIDNEVEVHKTADEALQQAFDTLTKEGSVNINGKDITDPEDLKKSIESMFQPKDQDDEDKHLFFEAATYAVGRGEISTSALQRRFSIGFQRASKLVDKMEEWGIVGERDGSKPRQVKVTAEELKALIDKARSIHTLYKEILDKLKPGATVSAPMIKNALATDMENATHVFKKLVNDGLLSKDGKGAMIYRGKA